MRGKVRTIHGTINVEDNFGESDTHVILNPRKAVIDGRTENGMHSKWVIIAKKYKKK